MLFIDQKGEPFLIDITSNVQCVKMIKMCINNHDEQVLVIFTATQIVLFRNVCGLVFVLCIANQKLL